MAQMLGPVGSSRAHDAPKGAPGPRPLRRALITGARGFLGRALAARLAADGVEVVCTTRGAAPAHQDEIASRDAIQWVQSDVGLPGQASELLRRTTPDAVFHLAGSVTGSRDVGAVLPTFYSLLGSAVELLVAAAQQPSQPTCVLAGSLEDPMFQDVPGSPYAAAKEGVRRYGALFHQLYGLPVVTARIFMVYGPGVQDERRFVPYVIRSLQHRTRPSLSSGSRLVDWVYLDDVVEGLLALAGCSAAFGRTVDLGSGRPTTVRDVGDLLASLLGTHEQLPWGSQPDRQFERISVADSAEARALCGWEPATSLPDGLKKTIAWFEEHPSPVGG